MAKRVNKKFLLGLTVAIVGMAMALLLVIFFSRHRSPKRFIALAKKAVAEQRYDDALANYRKAIRLDKGNPELFIECGDVLNHMVSIDQQYLGQARAMWQEAQGLDPRDKASLQRLTRSYSQELDASGARPFPGSFTSLRENALKLSKIDPADVDAAATVQIVTIRQYLSGISTPARAVDESIAAVVAMRKKYPDHADLLYYAALGKLRRASDQAKLGDQDKADQLIAEVSEMTDAAAKTQSDNAAVLWRAAIIYQNLGMLETKFTSQYQAAAATCANRASTLARPEDANYAQIQFAAFAAAQQAKDGKRAEQILRDFYRQSPDDPQAALQLGQFLANRPASRDEGIQILSKPFSAEGREGVRALSVRFWEAERLYRVSMYRADAYASTADPARRKILLDEIQDGLAKLNALSSAESLNPLRLKARVHELRGETIEAMATFQRALNLMDRNGVKDYELMYDAARLDMQMGQTGSALKLLNQIVDFNGSFLPARLYLADLYLRQEDTQSAERQIEALEKLAPDSNDARRLRVTLYTLEKNPEQVKASFAKLPESNDQERLAKAQLALQTRNYSEAIRLLEVVRKQSVDNAPAMVALAQAYAVQDKKDQAKAVVADALKATPNDRRLLILEKQLENASPEEMEKLNEQLLAGVDEYTREIQEYQLAMARQNPDEALKHLQAAEKLKPDDKLVAQLYFDYDLRQRLFDQAEKQIPVLVRLKADEADGWLARTRLALARGDLKTAVDAAKQVVSRRPEFAVSYALLGQTYLRSAQEAARAGQAELADQLYQNSIREFQGALDRQSVNREAILGLVDAYSGTNQIDKLGEMIERGRQLYPDSSQFRELALNHELLYSAHPEKVIEERGRLLQADPSANNYLALAQAQLHLAQVNSGADSGTRKKYTDQAQDILTQAVAKFPGEIRVIALLAQVFQYGGNAAGGEKLLLDLANQVAWKDKPEPDRLLAEYYLRAGAAAPAEAALRRAYEKSGHNIDSQLALAQLLTRESKFDDALKLLADNAADARVARQRVQTFVSARRFDDAEKTVKELLAASPGSIDLLNLCTSVYLQAGRPADAQTAARNALAADRTNDVALYQQAVAEASSPEGDLDLAMRDLNSVKERAPNFIRGRLLLAQVRQRRGQNDEAVRELEDAVATARTSRDARISLLNAYASFNPPRWAEFDRTVAEAEADPQLREDPTWLQEEAGGLAARKQLPAAIAKMTAAMKLSPDNPTLENDYLGLLLQARNDQALLQETAKLFSSGKKQWWIYFYNGMGKALSGDKAGALASLDKAIAVGDAANDGAAATRVLQEMAQEVGFDEAMSRAQARAAQDPAWKMFTLDLYRRKGDWAGAVKTAEALGHDTSTLSTGQKIYIQNTLANGYQALNQPEKARDAYLAWLALVPNDRIALNNLAFLLAETLHRPADAKAYSQQAYNLAQQTGGDINAIRDTHGWILSLCGGRDAANGIGLLRQAVEENDHFLEAQYHLGKAYLMGSKPDADDAEEHLNRANALAKFIEANHGQVSQDIKTGIQQGLDRVKQLRSAKSDASDH